MTITISDWLMITAVLLAPFIAVFAQRKIDLIREKRNHRFMGFSDLNGNAGQ